MTEELTELRDRAARHGRKGSYGREAVRLNEQILELDRSDVTALLRLIRCHEETGDWLAAHESYGRLLELEVGDEKRIRLKLEETLGLAAEQIEARRLAEARERERQARDEERRRKLAEEVQAIDSFLHARTLAIAARDARDHDLALAYHDRSLTLAASVGDRTGALAAKAATLRRAGRPAEALAVLRQSIELDGSRERNKPSYTSLVATLREVGALEEARREGEALLQLYGEDSFVLYAVGRVFRALFERDGEPALLERAEGYYRRASELQPGDRNILAELRSLIALYDDMTRRLGWPELAEKARELERHLARLEPRLPDAASFSP